jgi:hypothetical protein
VTKKVFTREACEAVRALIRMGKARAIKEYVDGEAVIFLYSASGALMGEAGKKYRYLFEQALAEHGSRDGLFEGFDQTTRIRS